MKKFIIYGIYHENTLIYVGRTSRFKRRIYEHNYHYRKGQKKKLYEYLEFHQVETIELIPLYEEDTLVEAKRRELWIMLTYYYSDDCRNLLQRIPRIRD